MPVSRGYKDKGDRVVVVHPDAFGEAGTVGSNNGWGMVMVELDNGTRFYGYETRDLIYEGEPLPDQPIDPES